MSQQLTRAEVIGVATLSVWAGGVVYLTSSFAERTFDAAPGGHPTAGDLLVTAVVLVGVLFIIRELLVARRTGPPDQDFGLGLPRRTTKGRTMAHVRATYPLNTTPHAMSG